MMGDGVIKKTKFNVKPVGKFFLHYKSHLNDPTLQPRKLEASENIFEIIMPWVPDLRHEQLLKMNEKLKLGLITEKEYKKHIAYIRKNTTNNAAVVNSAFGGVIKQQEINSKGGTQSKLGNHAQIKTKEEDSGDSMDLDSKIDGKDGKDRPKTEAEIYSRSIKSSNVENFDWTYEEKIWNGKTGRFQMEKVELDKVEAIYINPKWKQSRVGEFLTFDKKKLKKKKDRDPNNLVTLT